MKYVVLGTVLFLGLLLVTGVGVTEGFTPPPTPAAPSSSSPEQQRVITLAPTDQALQGAGYVCLTRNPSCGRDAWWQVFMDLPVTTETVAPVTYAPLGAFATPALLAEAVLWAWASPIGRQLLLEAARAGVTVTISATVPRASLGEVVAWYTPGQHRITVNARYLRVSSVLLAEVLVHELQHAADDAHGRLTARRGPGCIAQEAAAFGAAVAFGWWVADQMGGLPSPSTVAAASSREDQALFAMLRERMAAPDLLTLAAEAYRRVCA